MIEVDDTAKRCFHGRRINSLLEEISKSAKKYTHSRQLNRNFQYITTDG